jgi:hypothetical protein
MCSRLRVAVNSSMDIEAQLRKLLTPGKVSDDYKLGRELGT